MKIPGQGVSIVGAQMHSRLYIEPIETMSLELVTLASTEHLELVHPFAFAFTCLVFAWITTASYPLNYFVSLYTPHTLYANICSSCAGLRLSMIYAVAWKFILSPITLRTRRDDPHLYRS